MRLLLIACLLICMVALCSAGRTQYPQLTANDLMALDLTPHKRVPRWSKDQVEGPAHNRPHHVQKAKTRPKQKKHAAESQWQPSNYLKNLASSSYVDFGAHTGNSGAFGWYADFPARRK